MWVCVLHFVCDVEGIHWLCKVVFDVLKDEPKMALRKHPKCRPNYVRGHTQISISRLSNQDLNVGYASVSLRTIENHCGCFNDAVWGSLK